MASLAVTERPACIIDGGREHGNKKVGEEIDVIRSTARIHVEAFIIHTCAVRRLFGSVWPLHCAVQAGAMATSLSGYIKPAGHTRDVGLQYLWRPCTPALILTSRTLGAVRSGSSSFRALRVTRLFALIIHLQFLQSTAERRGVASSKKLDWLWIIGTDNKAGEECDGSPN